MSIEEQIREHNGQRRLNIMKGIDNLEPDYIEKAFDGDLEKAKQYADNGVNRKMNRVGQTYGGGNGQDDQENQQNQSNDEENSNSQNFKGNQTGENSSKFEAPKSEESGERVEYAEAQLQEFAQQADDASLQKFLEDAANSGDNSEYMQSQINIAQTELNNRNGQNSDNQMNQEQGDQGQNENGEMGTEDNGDQENSGEIDYSNPDSVRGYLDANPEVKAAIVEMMMEDISLSASQALRLHQASTTSGSEALQHVEAAKQTLDELHAKLGGGASSEENGEGGETSGNVNFGQLSDDDRNNFDAPEDAVIAHVGEDSAIYSASEGYLEIVYGDGNYKQFENVTSPEEAMKIVQENITSDEAQADTEETANDSGQNNNEAEEGNDNNEEGTNDEEDEDLKESNAWAKELSNPTDKSKGMNNTQIDEKQADHYRKYEAKKNKK
jgi:hypothetical protein